MRLHSTRMLLVFCVLAGALAAPAVAQAASASVDRACYPSDGSAMITITGAGFTPDTEVLVQVAGSVVGVTGAGPTGDVKTTLAVPVPPTSGPSRNDKAYEVSLVQGPTTATAGFRTATTMGDFGPSNGRPSSLRVRFSAFGFGLQTAPGQAMPTVYVHYVDPRGKVRRTISLGAGAGPCGTIARTALRKLFPFNPKRGTWTLQFDTNATYRRGTDLSRFLFDRVTLTIT
jgi:hypothetical protein